MLDVILALIFNSLYACEMNNLVPVLQHLVEDKDEEKKEIATKAKMICAILVSQGISGQSSSSEVLELQMHIQEYKRENEESKRKVEEFERNDDVQKRKIIELEHQLEESKQKASEISISITVPSGSYTKKEGEFTYISTFDEYKTFTILPIITQGIFKLELKINVIQWLWYGLVKSGLVIPLLTHPFKFNNNMFFFNSGIVYQNSSRYNGNQEMKNGDIVTIELNMALPRTAHLFINNVQQPVYMSGIPDSVQYFFTLQNKNDSVTVLSLKNLTVPSTANLPNATEMKWE
ncbi:MAG: hypothetical protein EZS28_008143 [Streblomastix strix]|uniref:SPRY domain-containing protein n=1 Tax=Streblomastix strix TaxID=222440 RepID=A0A5J4WN64_9EUKA|nr:MAG: hypothetical protein EZS28_008143 [Streblomastix strix]